MPDPLLLQAGLCARDGSAEAHLDLDADAGVSVLEIGAPTSDPYLDGPEIEGSMRRALAAA